MEGGSAGGEVRYSLGPVSKEGGWKTRNGEFLKVSIHGTVTQNRPSVLSVHCS